MKEITDMMNDMQLSMSSEIKPVEEIQVRILNRMVQVEGDLYEYSPLTDSNILRVKNVFLCIDQIGNFQYMINVVDGAQKTSFTRRELTNMSDFQINQAEQGLNFIGVPRKNQYIPGYLFKIKSAQNFESLRGILTKCIFQEQNKSDKGRGEDYDEEFLAQQLEGNFNGNADVDMKELDKSADFDFRPNPSQRIDDD